MKIAIAGAGAMGCRFGAMLHQSGESVLLVDGWEEHVAVIQQHGLTMMHEKGTTTVRIKALMDASTVGIMDAVIVFTKAMHTKTVVRNALPMIGESTQVLTFQNGLGNIEAISSYIPRDQIIAGVTNFGTELVGPGAIRALGSGETMMMSVNGQLTESLGSMCSVMNAAGLNVRIEPNVFSMIWQKVAFNAVYNPLAAITHLKALDIGRYAKFEEVAFGILNEIVAVAKAEGVNGIERDEIFTTIKSVLDPDKSGEHLTSMLQDVLAKRPTEIAYLNGAIMEMAQTHGIAVPYNTLLTHLISILETTYELRIDVVHK